MLITRFTLTEVSPTMDEPLGGGVNGKEAFGDNKGRMDFVAVA
jgi:hypothetical protein